MTARRATPADDDLLRSIVLHPEVHRHNGAGFFTPSVFTRHPTNFAVVVDGGCFTAVALERAAYAIHTNFLPEARGAHAMRESRAALHYAFTQTDAEVLYTRVDELNPRALWFARSMGFTPLYTAGTEHFLRLDIDDWIRSSTALRAAGEDFHEEIEAADHLEHKADPVHDAYVGAARAMIEVIQFEKAERIYGRWARMAGYQPLAFVGIDPPRIDIGTCVLRLVLPERTFIIEEKDPCQPQAQQS